MDLKEIDCDGRQKILTQIMSNDKDVVLQALNLLVLLPKNLLATSLKHFCKFL